MLSDVAFLYYLSSPDAIGRGITGSDVSPEHRFNRALVLSPAGNQGRKNSHLYKRY